MMRRSDEWFALFAICCLAMGWWLWLEASRIPPEPMDQAIESVDVPIFEGDRSSQWQAVRDAFVRKYPACEACGSKRELNVHHVRPFALWPELELVESNLITLCREHHFRIGHDPDGPWKPKKPSWSESNRSVRRDVQKWKAIQ